MGVRSVALTCAIVAGVPNGAVAAPGDRLAAENARLGADQGLTPLKPSDVDPTRFVTGPPQPADGVPGGGTASRSR
jgi:hypothetical protein